MDLSSELSAILQVIFINVVLSGDNAIVVGMAAAGAPPAIRQKVIFYGIAGAVVLRVLLSLLAVQFLQVVGLLLAGGILLLWVCWKLFREIRSAAPRSTAARRRSASIRDGEIAAESTKSLGEAMWQIIVADVSMSLDNVLAIAGAAREHPLDHGRRPRPLRRADGPRRDLHRAPARPLSLARLDRPPGHPLRRRAHDLGRRLGGRRGVFAVTGPRRARLLRAVAS